MKTRAFFEHNVSLLALLIMVALSIGVMNNVRPWKRAGQNGRIIAWDITSYYSYLPAYFIEDDIRLNFIEGQEQFYMDEFKYWPNLTPEGKPVIKTTMGQAMMYAPFFFIAHWDTLRTGNYAADGFTIPYERGLAWSSAFYLIIGFIFLRRLLRLFVDDWSAALTLLAVFLGTNLFYYASTEPAMPHAYIFSMSCVFLFLGIKWKREGGYLRAAFMGLIGGWLCLTRPTLFFIVIAPFLYFERSIKEEGLFYLSKWKELLLIAIMALLIISPQLFYWKMITGHWVYYSYTDERFYFDNPHVVEFLFSYRKGWFLYTPLMLFACIGFIPLYRKSKAWFWMSLTIIVTMIYINSSWWCWWFGGGFGQRSMIDFYSLLCIPLAVIISYLFMKNNWLRIGMIGFLLIVISMNLFQTHQKRRAVIHWDSMTKEAYWASFMSMDIPTNYFELFRTPDYESAKAGKEEILENQ